MNAKISPNLISFITVRRGEWILKVSVYKNKQIMVVAYNVFDFNLVAKTFLNQNDAAEFIETLVVEDRQNDE